MKPYLKIAEAALPDGTVFTLHRHDGQIYLKNGPLDLMSTSLTYSEQQLAVLGCADLVEGSATRPEHPRILIGGLGLGFTLKKALEMVGRPATVTVAELVPEIVEWNRTFMVEHNGPLLDDERTDVYEGDFYHCLNEKDGKFDAILIDIDDSPDFLITEGNARLYKQKFLHTIRGSLAPGGCVAYWVAEPTPSFQTALGKAGFEVELFRVGPHEKSKRSRHGIYVCRKG